MPTCLAIDEVNRFHFETKLKAPYWQQGDERWDAPQILKQREELRKSHKVRSACLQFWSTFGLSPAGELTFDGYRCVWLSRCGT